MFNIYHTQVGTRCAPPEGECGFCVSGLTIDGTASVWDTGQVSITSPLALESTLALQWVVRLVILQCCCWQEVLRQLTQSLLSGLYNQH